MVLVATESEKRKWGGRKEEEAESRRGGLKELVNKEIKEQEARRLSLNKCPTVWFSQKIARCIPICHQARFNTTFASTGVIFNPQPHTAFAQRMLSAFWNLFLRGPIPLRLDHCWRQTIQKAEMLETESAYPRSFLWIHWRKQEREGGRKQEIEKGLRNFSR